MAQSSLFERREGDGRPLADRMRPVDLDGFVGQSHLLGEGRPLRRLAEAGNVHSMILWGPPGVGKTTLGRLLAEAAGARLTSLSAVLAGIRDVRAAIADAQAHAGITVLFIDEVHRFNKAQQDAFLPHVERGTITFIGATTENPSFEVNAALLSRSRVYVLKPLGDDDLAALVRRATEELDGATVDEEGMRELVAIADGDARRALNTLEVATQLAPDAAIGAVHVIEAAGQSHRRFDKGGDAFYDQISALHKAVRGSAPDAALYWLARMLDGGCDPAYIARRLTRMAVEDIGLADPRALQITVDAWEAWRRLGSPEGDLALAEACVYLAATPKSNAIEKALDEAMAYVGQTPSWEVPARFRNAPTKLMASLGHGKGYRYAHDEEGGYAAGERYFPDEMPDMQFYRPGERGVEGRIAARLAELRALDAAGEPDPEPDPQA